MNYSTNMKKKKMIPTAAGTRIIENNKMIFLRMLNLFIKLTNIRKEKSMKIFSNKSLVASMRQVKHANEKIVIILHIILRLEKKK